MILNTLRMSALALTITMAAVATPSLAQTTNTQTIKLFYDAISQDKPDLLDKVLAKNWEDVPPNPGQGLGRDAMKPVIDGFHKTFADMHVVNDQIIDAGKFVIVRSTISGTQVGPFAGFKAKNQPFKVMAVDIHEFEDGKVVRTWHVEDWLGGLFQMGAFQ
ncbi:ester cyclase [Mesorhizobium sp. INR15]|uniref:ester cyclase n=1 Tax=Mesorhizobium sp. INR15 TaxID=2654248 RepID=UPI00189649AE|nr:ester cyclase [Mesorhizobium sp. INR15]